MTQQQQGRPGAGAADVLNSDAGTIVTPTGDVLLPVCSGIFSEPHRGRGRTLVVALDCPHCHGDHRHTTPTERPGGLVRPCPVTGRSYVVLPLSRRRAVRRG